MFTIKAVLVTRKGRAWKKERFRYCGKKIEANRIVRRMKQRYLGRYKEVSILLFADRKLIAAWDKINGKFVKSY